MDIYRRKDYLLDEFLVEEILKDENDSPSDWQEIYSQYVKLLLQVEDLNSLAAKTRLCMAMVIIGSKNLDDFTLAFRLMSDWESAGGPFWVVQEEILRFASLRMIRQGFINEKAAGSLVNAEFNVNQFKEALKSILPEKIPNFVKHTIVKEKMSLLRSEMEELVADLSSSEDPGSVYLDYADQFPLNKWYLEWTMRLLKRVAANPDISNDIDEREDRVSISRSDPMNSRPKRLRNCNSEDQNKLKKKLKQVDNEKDSSDPDSDNDSSQEEDPQKPRTYGRQPTIALTSLSLSCLPELSLGDKLTSLMKHNNNNSSNNNNNNNRNTKLVRSQNVTMATVSIPQIFTKTHLVSPDPTSPQPSLIGRIESVDKQTLKLTTSSISSVSSTESLTATTITDEEGTIYESVQETNCSNSHLYKSVRECADNNNNNNNKSNLLEGFATVVWNLLSLSNNNNNDNNSKNDEEDKVYHDE